MRFEIEKDGHGQLTLPINFIFKYFFLMVLGLC
jgi:hypothetical protein